MTADPPAGTGEADDDQTVGHDRAVVGKLLGVLVHGHVPCHIHVPGGQLDESVGGFDGKEGGLPAQFVAHRLCQLHVESAVAVFLTESQRVGVLIHTDDDGTLLQSLQLLLRESFRVSLQGDRVRAQPLLGDGGNGAVRDEHTQGAHHIIGDLIVIAESDIAVVLGQCLDDLVAAGTGSNAAGAQRNAHAERQHDGHCDGKTFMFSQYFSP